MSPNVIHSAFYEIWKPCHKKRISTKTPGSIIIPFCYMFQKRLATNTILLHFESCNKQLTTNLIPSREFYLSRSLVIVSYLVCDALGAYIFIRVLYIFFGKIKLENMPNENSFLRLFVDSMA